MSYEKSHGMDTVKIFLKVGWGKTHVVLDLKVMHGCSIDVGGIDMSVSMFQNVEGRNN